MSDTEPSSAGKPLSKDAQASKDGFDEILGGSDPRLGMGRIPPESSAPKSNVESDQSADGSQSGSKPLSPEAQAIKDGFDEMLGGRKDSRISYGMIPKKYGKKDGTRTQAEEGKPVVDTAEKPLSPAAQAIKDGFDRLLDGKKDSRMSYGKIPKEHD